MSTPPRSHPHAASSRVFLHPGGTGSLGSGGLISSRSERMITTDDARSARRRAEWSKAASGRWDENVVLQSEDLAYTLGWYRGSATHPQHPHQSDRCAHDAGVLLCCFAAVLVVLLVLAALMVLVRVQVGVGRLSRGGEGDR